VSLRRLELAPPKSTLRPFGSSNTIAALERALGPVSATWVHRVPFHAQVSFKSFAPTGDHPPNSKVLLLGAWYVMEWDERALGPMSCS
jgi:hypothetical protein